MTPMTRDQAIEIAKQLFGSLAPLFVDIHFALSEQEFDEPTNDVPWYNAAEEKFIKLYRTNLPMYPMPLLRDLHNAGLAIVEKKP